LTQNTPASREGRLHTALIGLATQNHHRAPGAPQAVFGREAGKANADQSRRAEQTIRDQPNRRNQPAAVQQSRHQPHHHQGREKIPNATLHLAPAGAGKLAIATMRAAEPGCQDRHRQPHRDAEMPARVHRCRKRRQKHHRRVACQKMQPGRPESCVVNGVAQTTRSGLSAAQMQSLCHDSPPVKWNLS
jgi:hypothetical protein